MHSLEESYTLNDCIYLLRLAFLLDYLAYSLDPIS